jgi:hypothetical protein
MNRKREIVNRMRTKAETCLAAAKELGVSRGQVVTWLVHDEEFGQAVKNVRLVREIDFVLAVDDMAREAAASGRKLSQEELELVDTARCFGTYLLAEADGKLVRPVGDEYVQFCQLPLAEQERVGFDERSGIPFAVAMESALARAKVSGLAG